MWLGARPPRDDKVLDPSQARDFLNGPIVVEEKVDGTNLGISLDREGRLQAQSRGEFVKPGGHPQFGPLWQWLAEHNQTLGPALGGRLVLFGEWCFAVHTVQYSRLPDWLLAFDVFDRMKGSFWSTELRDRWLSQLNIAGVPELAKGEFSLAELKTFLEENSRLGEAPMEGLYLRREEGQRLRIRAKLVRPDFVETIDQHWSARSLTRNRRAKPSFR